MSLAGPTQPEAKVDWSWVRRERGREGRRDRGSGALSLSTAAAAAEEEEEEGERTRGGIATLRASSMDVLYTSGVPGLFPNEVRERRVQGMMQREVKREAKTYREIERAQYTICVKTHQASAAHILQIFLRP